MYTSVQFLGFCLKCKTKKEGFPSEKRMVLIVNVTFSWFVCIVVGGRSPKMGGDTIHILSEDSIKVYLVYMDQLKSLFTKFIHQNWNEQRRVS